MHMGNYIVRENYKTDYNLLYEGEQYHLDYVEDIGNYSLYYMTNSVSEDRIIFCDIDTSFDTAFESFEYSRHKNSMEILFPKNI